MKNFIKENWSKLLGVIALLLIGISVFSYLVIYIPYQNRATTRIEEENKYWSDLKNEIDGRFNDAQSLLTSTNQMITNQENWLNGVYPDKDKSYYKQLLPAVNAAEHYLITLKTLRDTINSIFPIYYEINLAIKKKDQLALDTAINKENNVGELMVYWGVEVQKEMESINLLKTRILKDI